MHVARTLKSRKVSHTLAAKFIKTWARLPRKPSGGLVKPTVLLRLSAHLNSVRRCRYLCRWTENRIFKSFVLPDLLYGCETGTLNRDLERRINIFSNKCLRRFMGYRRNAFVLNRRLLRDTDLTYITCITRQRKLRPYQHVAHYLEADPSHRVVTRSKSRVEEA